MFHRFSYAVVAAACCLGGAGAASLADDALVEAGRRIYETGTLIAGTPLIAQREGGVALSGPGAACVNCHRASGMGSIEGGAIVPPIAGPLLFSAPVKPRRRPPAKGITVVEFRYLNRPPYDDASLARALTSGISPSGAPLGYLMPRFVLGDRDMKALTAYLRTLSTHISPGVDDDTVHFATVVTPGADAAQKNAMLEVLRTCFAERVPRIVTPGLRKWDLHVWELAGPESDWPSQLERYQHAQPVFAVISGLGAGGWDATHRFCEREALPCLFPNTDLPGGADRDRMTFYFNDGVLLEARVLARHLIESRNVRGHARLIQLLRPGDVGTAAARVLDDTLKQRGVMSEIRTVSDADNIATVLTGVAADDTLVLWLRPNDVERLTRAIDAPPAARAILFSGTLGGFENIPLPAAWRSRAQFTYPLDPPGRRGLRMRFNLHPWLAKNGLPRSDDPALEILRGNTLTACKLLDDAMTRMRTYFFRDYLIELIETPMGNSAATSAYPRFSLGVGQRFASKGSYIVRFAGATGPELVPLTDWIVP